ncbi:MAG: Fic family protein, partial [Candidatus Thermoplasmatota archaeon]|nr:Fic family protein [Candidatus Thermoplasmatota archaeon]
GGKVKKKRIYLGKDLDRNILKRAEMAADRELNILSGLLEDEEILELERLKERYGEVPEASLNNRYEAFISRFTHDSTAIEGNTLTLQETAGLLFENLTPSSKDLREINEVINHREAFDMMLSYEGDISREFVLKLHEMVVRKTLSERIRDQIGRYRTVQVYIRGVEWMPPAPEDVPVDMKELFRWYTQNKTRLHPLVLAAYFHAGFETIHPFVDGNGRVGRLLLNFILHRNGFPMVNIPNKRKFEYYECLERSQVDGDLRPLVRFLYDLMIGTDPLL